METNCNTEGFEIIVSLLNTFSLPLENIVYACHFFLIDLTSVSICGPVDFQKVMLEKGNMAYLPCTHLHVMWSPL